MAPIKRKNGDASESARPEKKRKPSSTAKPSVLKEEEPAFPRGGASVLTPLEHKQIQIQAKEDVLFEQKTGKKATKNDFEDDGIDEENDENLPEQADTPVAKRKGGSRLKGKKSRVDGTIEELGVRIEGLSYKVGSPGTWHVDWLTVGPAACSRLHSPWTGLSNQSL